MPSTRLFVEILEDSFWFPYMASAPPRSTKASHTFRDKAKSESAGAKFYVSKACLDLFLPIPDLTFNFVDAFPFQAEFGARYLPVSISSLLPSLWKIERPFF